MSDTKYRLNYEITANASKAKAELKDVDRLMGKIGSGGGGASGFQKSVKGIASEISNLTAIFTGDRLSGATSQITSFGNAFSAIPGPAGLAVGAVAGFGTAVTTAAVGAGAALFALTQQASDYGSIIHDASDKTGLHAEALSAMQLAADQSGTSLDQVTTGIAKYSKLVGAAADGSKEAAKQLKELGVSPQEAFNDLDGSLGKVFKRIEEARPGVEQITLAQKAFGKSGADLLPFIKQFDGDLPGLIAKAKELGLTLSDKDATAADDFGDQMDTLTSQLKHVGYSIGFQVMPYLTKFAEYASKWLGENQGEIKTWGDKTIAALTGVAGYWHDATSGIHHYREEFEKLGGIKIPETGFSTGGIGTFDPKHPGLIGEGQKALLRKGGYGEAAAYANQEGGGRSFKGDLDLGDVPGSGGKGGRATANVFKPSPKAQAIINAANKLGISPLDLATIISFETAGTYSPSIKGGDGGNYQGLIQFGKEERQKYGVHSGQSFEDQVQTSVVKYFQDRFGKVGKDTAGASLLDLYRTVLGGSPNASLTGKDAFGTSPASGVARMVKENRPDALKRFFGGKEVNAKGDPKTDLYGQFLAQEDSLNNAELDAVKSAIDEMQAAERKATEERLDIRRAEAEKTVEIIGAQVDAGILTEKDGTEQLGKLKLDLLKEERDEIGKQTANSENLHKLRVLDIQIQTQGIKNERERSEIERKRYEKLLGWKASIDALERATEERDAAADAKASQRARATSESQSAIAPGTLLGGIAGGTGTQLPSIWQEHTDAFGNVIETIKSQGQIVKDIYGDVSSFAGGAIGSMVEGLGQMAIAWIVTGEGSAKAALQMMASTALSIAFQAGLKAIFEAAESAAAFARYDVVAGTAHATAATIYGTVAAIAGTAGIGLAVASHFVGGGKSGSKNSNNSASSNSNLSPGTAKQDQQPSSRDNENTYISGRRDMPIQDLSKSIDRLEKKISGMRPGDVVSVGVAQRPGLIGNAAIKDVATNSTLGTKWRRVSGGR